MKVSKFENATLISDHHKGKLKSPAVRRYIHELVVDVGEHLNSVSTALSMFIEVG